MVDLMLKNAGQPIVGFDPKFVAQPILRPAATSKGLEAIRTFMEAVVPQIEKLNARVVSK